MWDVVDYQLRKESERLHLAQATKFLGFKKKKKIIIIIKLWSQFCVLVPRCTHFYRTELLKNNSFSSCPFDLRLKNVNQVHSQINLSSGLCWSKAGTFLFQHKYETSL